MDFQQRPLTEIEQGNLFLWMRLNCSLYDAEKLQKDLPLIAHNIFGAPKISGIPAKLYKRLQELVRAQMPIQAIKVVRQEMGWTLKEAKEFVDGL
jgi:hypothetical protein